MLTKYEVLTRIQLRDLEWQTQASPQPTECSWISEYEHFFGDFHEKLSRIRGFSGNFRNPSNFDELYLRAQEIFFQNFKIFENTYV